jgi:hypothetical protein
MTSTKKRRLEITVETHNLTIIRTSSEKENFVRCRKCEQSVLFWSPANAALIFQTTERQLEQLIGSGQIHFAAENAVCANSLARYFKRDIRFIED